MVLENWYDLNSLKQNTQISDALAILNEIEPNIRRSRSSDAPREDYCLQLLEHVDGIIRQWFHLACQHVEQETPFMENVSQEHRRFFLQVVAALCRGFRDAEALLCRNIRKFIRPSARLCISKRHAPAPDGSRKRIKETPNERSLGGSTTALSASSKSKKKGKIKRKYPEPGKGGATELPSGSNVGLPPKKASSSSAALSTQAESTFSQEEGRPARDAWQSPEDSCSAPQAPVSSELFQNPHVPLHLDRLLKIEPVSTVVNNERSSASRLLVPPVFMDPTHSTVIPASQRSYSVQGFTRKDLPPTSFPPIWAKSRQEVCESLEWFRSYQGGVYYKDDFARGYLLSGFPSQRDEFQHAGKLIISHGGGKAASVHSKGGIKAKQGCSDQSVDDASVRSLLRNYRTGRPLAMLIDKDYRPFSYSLASSGITYAVLGWYTIVAAWAERQSSAENKIRFKFAFQWCEAQGKPWWFLDNEEILLESKRCSSMDANCLRICSVCNNSSPHVYQLGWACMAPACVRFFNTLDGIDLSEQNENLQYRKEFLALRSDAVEDNDTITNLSLAPQLNLPKLPTADVTTYAFTRGFHCKSCGRLSSRIFWTSWSCSNCGTKIEVTGKIHHAKDFFQLWKQHKEVSLPKASRIKHDGQKSFLESEQQGATQTFVLPGGRGKIHHIKAGRPVYQARVHEIFKAYQEQANDGTLVFRRWPMRAHQCRGDLLTHYFSHNTGMPYNYVGGDDGTVSFEQAPAVEMARDYIMDRLKASKVMEDGPAEFNEILSAAYMEKQSMAYHCDSEHGLGPIVAGLSMGAPALMEFREKKKKWKSKSEVIEEETKTAADLLIKYDTAALSVRLLHGDILVMEGSGVQDFYEHRVTPTGFRIAATARIIDPMKNTNRLGNKPGARIKVEDSELVARATDAFGGPNNA